MSVLLLILAASPLTTVAEQSAWTKTGRYAEVERVLRRVPQSVPRQGEV